MREIVIPASRVKKWIENPKGIALCIPVYLNWSELQLTESQIIENAIALVNGERQPFEDNSFVNIVILMAKE